MNAPLNLDPPLTRPPSLARRFEAATGFAPSFWLAAVGCSAMAMALLAGRMWRTGDAGHLSLVWDVFLAWVPVPLALLAYRQARRARPPRAITLAALAGWLLFFPNSPYLVTEFIHLHPDHLPSPRHIPHDLRWAFPDVFPPAESPGWYELLLMTAVAAAGLAVTVASFRLAQRTIARLYSPRAAAAATPLLLVLTAFGVALGRFARLNSWDVFHEPDKTAGDIVTWATDPKASIATFVVAVLLILLNVVVAGAGGGATKD
ncbi:MAG: hypothetical protein JWO31_1020 [Phycisphaerales bacterium]|nr:hypothetical protein [Phycisphaerales bacterium]